MTPKRENALRPRTFRLEQTDLHTLAMIAERNGSTVTATARTLLQTALEAVRAHYDAEKREAL